MTDNNIENSIDKDTSENAFNKLANSIQPGADEKARQFNLPKIISEIREVKGMISSLFFLLFGIIMGIIVYTKSHSTTYALLASSILGIGAIILFLISFIGLRQLRNAEKIPDTFNQFQTGTAVTYNTPKPKSKISTNETIIDWLGPVSVGGKAGISWTVLEHESMNQSINTLLFTNYQIIAFLIGPQDVPTASAGGTLNQVASAFINYSDGSAFDKNAFSTILYANKWQDIVASLIKTDLNKIIDSHLNYGIPFTSIDSYRINTSSINSGLTLYLKDGGKMSFTTQRKDLLNQTETAIKKFIKPKS